MCHATQTLAHSFACLPILVCTKRQIAYSFSLSVFLLTTDNVIKSSKLQVEHGDQKFKSSYDKTLSLIILILITIIYYILIICLLISFIHLDLFIYLFIYFPIAFQPSNPALSKRPVMPPYGKTERAGSLVLDHHGTAETEETNNNELSFTHLSSLVQKVVASSSWWELYGVDLALLAIGLACLPVGFLLLRSSNAFLFIAGFLLLGFIHSMITMKYGHSAVHNALAGRSKFWNNFLSIFCTEICGGFTCEGSHEIHIQYHHPYTNVIGLGDSSSWKAPFLGRANYLFFAPLFLPLIFTPFAFTIIARRSVLRLACTTSFGYVLHFCLLRYVSGLSVLGTLLCLFLTRSVLSIPYIHVNIFQHIGLPMYDVKRRPKRLQQMASSVLNLPRNPVLDYCFGHTIISCHVEHHLFPRLSDNMCLKIKPLVSRYLKSHGLPYNEDTYMNRLRKFYNEYDELMVKMPPITDFIGIQ